MANSSSQRNTDGGREDREDREVIEGGRRKEVMTCTLVCYTFNVCLNCLPFALM